MNLQFYKTDFINEFEKTVVDSDEKTYAEQFISNFFW